MNKQEKLTNLQTYAQKIKDRLSAGVFAKRNNSSFLKIDLAKTEAKIEKLRLELGGK
jgi:hypothetical protein